MAEWWEVLRAHFPLLDRRAYFFAGAQTPLADEVRAALEAFVDLWENKVWRMEETEWRTFDEAQRTVGSILECEASRIVLTEGTSHGLNLATNMVLAAWRNNGERPANVVIHHEAHPASSFPWLNAARMGAALEIRWGQPDPGGDSTRSLIEAIDEQTLSVVVTHVSHTSGSRFDVGNLVRHFPDRPWSLILDAAQSAGALRITDEVAQCDFVAFPSYKWLFGPPGVGFLVVSTDWIDRVGPPLVGWASVRDPFRMDARNLDLAPSSTGFRLGMPNFAGIAAAAAGARIALEAGPVRVEERIAHLTERLITGLGSIGVGILTPTESTHRAGIVVASISDTDSMIDRLLREDFEVGAELGRLRIDVHAYNSEREIDRMLEAIATIL